MNIDEFKPVFIGTSDSLINFPRMTITSPEKSDIGDSFLTQNGEINSRKSGSLESLVEATEEEDKAEEWVKTSEGEKKPAVQHLKSLFKVNAHNNNSHFRNRSTTEPVNQQNNDNNQNTTDNNITAVMTNSTMEDDFPRMNSIVQQRRPTQILTTPVELDEDGFKKVTPIDQKVQSDSAETVQIASQIKLIRTHPEYLRDISDFEFINQIGKGGFSKVWKANDLRTGKVCAIKELTCESLSGRYLLSFVREIHTMAVTQSRFVIPFVGYTITPPYSIITEYMPNDSLFVHSNKTHRKTALSGTHLSIIALCIANAMCILHDNNIIHRDIKALNILLDKNGLPRLCDFGTARVINQTSRLSKSIGTSSHMSPEILTSNVYNKKVDVFGYAMLLYEMAEAHNAYKNYKPPEIRLLIIDGVRPGFRYANKPMRKLIRSCWSQKPEDRPDFPKIFKEFLSGKAYFQGADVSQVVDFAKKLDKEYRLTKNIKIKPDVKPLVKIDHYIADLENRLKNKNSMLKPGNNMGRLPTYASGGFEVLFQKPSISKLSNEAIIQTIPFDTITQKDAYDDSTAIKYDVLKNPNSPEFFDYLNELKKTFTPRLFPTVFEAVFDILHDPTNVKAVKALLSLFLEVAEKNHNFLNKFHDIRLHTILPFTIKEVTGIIYRLLYIMFEYRPNLINPTYRRLINYYLTTDQNAAVTLLGKFVEKVSLCKDPYPVITFFIPYARYFMHHPAGVSFVDIFHYLLKEYSQFKKANISTIRPIFTSFIKSKNDDVSNQAMKAICSLYDPEFELPYSFLNNNLRYEDKCRLTVSLLLRAKFLPLSVHLFNNIITRAILTPDTFSLVFKFVSKSKEHAKIATQNLIWMKVVPQTTIQHTFELFLYLFKVPEFKQTLISSPLIFQFFVCLSKQPEFQYFVGLHSVLKRIDMTPEFAKELLSTGFLKNYAQQMKANENKTAQNQFLLTVDQLIKLAYTEDYIACLPIFLNILHMRNELTTGAIAVISSVSRYPKIAVHLASKDLVGYFKQLLRIQQMNQIAKFFLDNIERAMYGKDEEINNDGENEEDNNEEEDNNLEEEYNNSEEEENNLEEDYNNDGEEEDNNLEEEYSNSEEKENNLREENNNDNKGEEKENNLGEGKNYDEGGEGEGENFNCKEE